MRTLALLAVCLVPFAASAEDAKKNALSFTLKDTDAEIKKFCESEYKVTFPMMSKVVVKGKGITPLYDHLTSKDANPKTGGVIKWNFTKFLVGKDGNVVTRFEPAVKPDSKDVITAIEQELKK